MINTYIMYCGVNVFVGINESILLCIGQRGCN